MTFQRVTSNAHWSRWIYSEGLQNPLPKNKSIHFQLWLV